MRRLRRMKQPCTRLVLALALAGVLLPAACTSETMSELPATPSGGGTFSLTYTLPDAETHISRAGTTADVSENAINTLHLLFFAADAHRNGVYIETVSVTPPTSSSLSTGTIEITPPTGSNINNATDYDVLAVANITSYTTNAASLAGKTLGRASAELCATLPIAGMPTALLMTGTAVKKAGKNMNVDLLRAAVRIDLKKAATATTLTLNEVRLCNVPTAIPFFYSESSLTAARLNVTTAITPDAAGNARFYTTETYQDLTDARVRLTQGTCLLIKASSGSAGALWYRVNLITDANHIQFLQRNNAYTVTITGVSGTGAGTTDEAYYSEATLLGTISLSDWVESGVPTPPEIDIL